MLKVTPVQLEQNLKGLDYPTTKIDLLRYAERKGSDEKILRALKQLPNEQFKTPVDVSKAINDRQ